MAYANQESQRFKHPHIGAEHILIGLVKIGAEATAKAFDRHTIRVKELRQALTELEPPHDDAESMGKLPQTPIAKRALEDAIRESRARGQDYVDTGHVLLGILHQDDSVAVKMLQKTGVDVAGFRNEVIKILDQEAAQFKESIKEGTRKAGGSSSGGKVKSKGSATQPHKLAFDVWIDPGDADPEDLAMLFEALSEISRAAGGTGLVFGRGGFKVHSTSGAVK